MGLAEAWSEFRIKIGENGLNKNREIWAVSDQAFWCTFRGPAVSYSRRRLPRLRIYIRVWKKVMSDCAVPATSVWTSYQINRRRPQNSQWPPQQRMSVVFFLFNADYLIYVASRLLRSVTFMEYPT